MSWSSKVKLWHKYRRYFDRKVRKNSENFAFITFTHTVLIFGRQGFGIIGRLYFELHTSLVWSDILVIIGEQQLQYCLVRGSFCWAFDKEKIKLSINKPSSHHRHKHYDTTQGGRYVGKLEVWTAWPSDLGKKFLIFSLPLTLTLLVIMSFCR